MGGALTAIAESFARVTTSDSVAVYLWDGDAQRLELRAHTPAAPASHPEQLPPLVVDQELTSWAGRGREARLIDGGADLSSLAAAGGSGVDRSAIVVPLVVDDYVVGLIRSVKLGRPPYTQDQFSLAKAFADQAGLAIAAARAHRKQDERLEELAVLSEISQRMSEVATLRQVLSSAIQGAMRITGAEAGLVWRRGENRRFHLAASINVDAEALVAASPDQPQSLSSQMLRTGRPEVVRDLQEDERVTSRDRLRGLHALLGVPLRSDGQLYGALQVFHSRPGYFNESHVRQVEVVSAHADTALARAEAFEEATRLSITDELTGFYNARYLTGRLNEELARAERYGHELALVLIDSDALKRVNDERGHEAGNRHLVELARTIREYVRATDIVARYGGDEFVVLQPEAGLEAARATAERIRNAAATRLEGIATSVSIGVAAFPNVQEADALFREADRALHEAKARGKNTVVVAG
ncbi:hypothetical protein BH18CHL2_BH18CHL2_05730 [soil metagenome]